MVCVSAFHMRVCTATFQKTHAHRRLEDDVPLEVKRRRVGEVLALFRHRAKELFDQQVGSHQLVLVEGVSGCTLCSLAQLSWLARRHPSVAKKQFARERDELLMQS